MISIYIVTYKDNDALNTNLDSIFSSDDIDNNINVNIINNYSAESLIIDKNFTNKIVILNNVLRPNFSTGHLSRNWNQAIINGFENLLQPKNDIVITCQDDMVWDKKWYKKINSIHEFYTFYTCDNGDGLCSYKPNAIKKIGLWDEKFCGITYQEADFFLRALINNKEYSSINDYWHKRTHNTTDIIAKRSTGSDIYREHNGRHAYKEYTYQLFLEKWNNLQPENWNILSLNKNIIPKIKNYILYPFFEKDIDYNCYQI